MLDLGWQELMVIAFVLVLVIGPKDLPRVMRAFAKFIGKARSMATEFQSSMMEIANQDEFSDVKKALQDAKQGNFDEVASSFEDAVGDVSNDPAIRSNIDEIKASMEEIKAETDKAAKPAKKTAAKTKKKSNRKKAIS
jgi:sec-independent protein translocase protein TatB